MSSFLNYDIILNIIKQIKNPQDLDAFCASHPNNYRFCKYARLPIIKHLLDINNVEYTIPTNFIYIYSNIPITTFIKDGTFNLYAIYKLYSRLNKLTSISIRNTDISSIPILHNITYCNLSFNKLTNFPPQPSLVECIIMSNSLVSFSIQPSLVKCNLDVNSLVHFHTQPLLTMCSINNNSLKTFDIQPNLEICSLNNNKLVDFPIMDNLIKCSLNDNLVVNFPSQPNLTILFIKNNALTNKSFNFQPNIKHCVGYGNIEPLNYCMITPNINGSVPKQW